MKLEQFQMERMQSTWENLVRYNLSESGVHPATIGELIPDAAERDQLLGTELGYSQSNGTPGLRRSIAAIYPGATEENIIATVGTAEANFLISWLLTEPGDEVVMMLPNYMQLWGLARAFGAELKPLPLIEELEWAPDLDALDRRTEFQPAASWNRSRTARSPPGVHRSFLSRPADRRNQDRSRDSQSTAKR